MVGERRGTAEGEKALYFGIGKGGRSGWSKVALVPGKDLLLNYDWVSDSGPRVGRFRVISFWIRYFYHGETTGSFGFDAW